eukprot:UN27480
MIKINVSKILLAQKSAQKDTTIQDKNHVFNEYIQVEESSEIECDPDAKIEELQNELEMEKMKVDELEEYISGKISRLLLLEKRSWRKELKKLRENSIPKVAKKSRVRTRKNVRESFEQILQLHHA